MAAEECCQYPVLPVLVSMPMCLCRDHDEKWKQWKIYPTLILLFAGIVKPLCFMAAKWFEGYVRCSKLVFVAVVERYFVNFASSWWQ